MELRRSATASNGRFLLLLSLAALAALGAGCSGTETTEDEWDAAAKAGRDAAKAGRDAREVADPPDADVAVEGDAGLPDGGEAGLDASAGPDAAAPGSDAGATPNTFWLTLLHSSDTESAMVPSGTFGGVAYFTTVVKALKAQAASWQPAAQAGEVVRTGTLVVSAGDNFLAGLSFKTSLAHGVPFYETTAMQEIGYQVSALGNHDFDFGPDTTADLLRGFSPAVPFVSANLDVSSEAQLQAQAGAGRLTKSVTVDLGGEKVGVIGAVTEQLPSLSMIKSVAVGAMVAAVQAQVTALTNAGVNKIVLLSHNQALANDKLLVPQLRGVDIVVSGGGHEIAGNSVTVLATGDTAACGYPEYVADADGVQVPLVSAGSLYKYVGRLVAKFDSAGTLTAIDATLSTPVRVSNSGTPDAVAADSAVDTYVVTPIKNATAALKTVVVATSAVPLDGRRGNIRSQETNEGDLMADALLWQGQQLAGAAGVASPQVALQNGGGIRNDSILPAGTLSEYDTYAVAPFSNRVAISPAVSRDTLKALLENAVSKVAAVDGRFLQVAGLRFTWDGSLPARAVSSSGAVTEAGQRVRSVTLDDGTVLVQNGAVVSGAAISVATIDFLANGGDSSPYGGASFTILSATYQEALKNYLVSGLSGVVGASQYPAGGKGRITALNACGNGLVEAGEGCDDQNAISNDGCSSTCAVESGFACNGTPSVCTHCGNGSLDSGEDCDGTNLNGQTCLTVPGGFTGGELACGAGCLFDTSGCAQLTDLALFTFETSAPADAGPFAAESGARAGTATVRGSHAGTSTYSSPAGNGSARSFNSTNWAVGDYYQVTVPATGASGLQVSWDQTRSSTGPASFKLEWSTNGSTFQDLVASYAVGTTGWSSTSSSAASKFGPTALPAGANGAATVTLRFTATAAGAGTGTSRIDNILVTGLLP